MKKVVLVASLFCLLPALASAKTFYRWMDAQGATHYTVTAPEGISSTRVEIDTGVTSEEDGSGDDSSQPATPTPAASDNAQAATDTGKESTQGSKFKERCDQYRSNLNALKAGGELTTRNAKGELEAITAERRAQMIKEAEDVLSNCPPA